MKTSTMNRTFKTKARLTSNDYQVLKIVLVLLPFFKPQMFNYISVLNTTFQYLQLLDCALIGVFYLKKNRFSKFVLALTAYRIYMLIYTYYAIGSVSLTCLYRSATILGLAMCVEMMCKKSAINTLRGIYILLIIPLIVNLVCCIFGWSIIYASVHYYFLGMRTRFTDSSIPALLTALLISQLEHKTIITKKSITTFCIVLAQLVLQWVGTGLFLVTVFSIIVFLLQKKSYKLFNCYIVIFSSIALNIAIVFFKIQTRFSYIIETFLHKSTTFTGRTAIWERVIERIKENILWGHGEVGNGGIISVSWQTTRQIPAHNGLLQLLFDGGIIGTFFLAVVFIITINDLYKFKKSFFSVLITVGIAVTCLGMITEVLNYYVYFYLVLILGSNIKYIVSQEYRRR